jgi:TolB protein
MSRKHVPFVPLLSIIPLLAGLLLAGCSSNNNQAAFFTVSERCAYGPNNILAFAAFGGNGLRYLSSISENGGSVTTLTPSDNDADLNDEGGFHPAYSPDGTQIAMASRRGPSDDIFLIAAVGGDRTLLTQLTNDPGADTQPAWGPAGDRVAFTTNRDGNNNIYVLTTADPATQTPLVNDPANDQWACYPPADASKLAFQSDRAGNTDIWVLDIPAGTVTQVTNSAARDEQPAWSPDGTQILFTSNRAGDFDIWSVAPDGTGLTQITNDGRSDGYPQWEPGAGGRICFVRDRQVWVADAAGTNQQQLTRTF